MDPVYQRPPNLDRDKRDRAHRQFDHFRKFLLSKKKEDPEALLQQHREGTPTTELEELLDQYAHHCVDLGYKISSARQYCKTARRWFTRRGVYPLSLPPWLSDVGPHKTKPLTHQQVKKMVEEAEDLRDKAIITFLAQTGQGIPILTTIKYSDIRRFGEPFDSYGLVQVPRTRYSRSRQNMSEDEQRYKFVIGEDTMRLLDELKKEGTSDRVFDLGERQIARVILKVATDAGIQDTDDTELGRDQHHVCSRSLRDFWVEQVGRAGMHEKQREYMIGHKVHYDDLFENGKLLKAYRKAERFLRVKLHLRT